MTFQGNWHVTMWRKEQSASSDSGTNDDTMFCDFCALPKSISAFLSAIHNDWCNAPWYVWRTFNANLVRGGSYDTLFQHAMVLPHFRLSVQDTTHIFIKMNILFRWPIMIHMQGFIQALLCL
jgi:hypothetical protein